MKSLLGANEAHPAHLINAQGKSPFVLICEHASNHVPECLGDLGLSDTDRKRHIAWDIGAAGVAREMSRILDAPLFLQRYSRLVYDCNRSPENPAAMPEKSEVFDVPGNLNLSADDKLARTKSIYRPFLDAITSFLDERAASARPAIPISVHSFTPAYFGKMREVQIGLLFEHHDGVARDLEKLFLGYDTRLNEPYGPEHGVMHLMNQIAAPRGLAHLMLEIRNDLISDPYQEKQWATRVAAALNAHLRKKKKGT
jgi:predicted N-formylglutamate amidohydrolase